MIEIPLVGDRYTDRWPVVLVDDADAEIVRQYKWHISYYAPTAAPPRRGRGPYAVTTLKPKQPGGSPGSLGMHSFITGYTLTDHIDHNGLNNQRANLRPATEFQNRGNALPQLRGSSQYKGVFWSKTRRKWIAQIGIRRRSTHIGSYCDEREAAMAYDRAAREYFGEYAYLNFPDLLVSA
jgi:hypothetical protein